MHKKKFLTAVVAIVVIGLLLKIVLVKGTISSGTVVRSNDGYLELRIPKGAKLPGRAEEIFVTKIEDEEMPEDWADIKPVFLYRLEPDGWEFETPLEATLTIPWKNSGGEMSPPLLYNISQDGEVIEVLDNLNLTFDAKNEIATLKGDISHFSDLYADAEYRSDALYNGRWESDRPKYRRYEETTQFVDKFFTVSLNPGEGIYDVDETFPYTVTIASRSEYQWNKTRNSSVANGTRVKVGPQTIRGRTSTWETEGVLSPTEGEFGSGDIHPSETFTWTQSYTCDEEGTGTIYPATIRVNFTMQIEKKRKVDGSPYTGRPVIHRQPVVMDINPTPSNITCAPPMQQVSPPQVKVKDGVTYWIYGDNEIYRVDNGVKTKVDAIP